jgi:hypothetical protein
MDKTIRNNLLVSMLKKIFVLRLSDRPTAQMIMEEPYFSWGDTGTRKRKAEGHDKSARKRTCI